MEIASSPCRGPPDVVAAELGDVLVGTDALFVWDFVSQAPPEAWPSGASVRWVHVAAAGVDRLLLPAPVEFDVVVVGTGPLGRSIARLLGGVGLTVTGVARQARADDDFEDVVGIDDVARFVDGS